MKKKWKIPAMGKYPATRLAGKILVRVIFEKPKNPARRMMTIGDGQSLFDHKMAG